VGLGSAMVGDAAGPLAAGAASREPDAVAPAGASRVASRGTSIAVTFGIARGYLAPSAKAAAALKNHRLIDDLAAPDVAYRHDQRGAAVSLAEFKLATIGPSATMPAFGMCPEPAPIEPGDRFESPLPTWPFL
jgi:hypothetical protein